METMEIRKKRRICLVVAYDGTNYQGWQIQQNGNTIEAELNRALSALTKEPIEVSGASRTDSGVHARCNYAVFDTAVRMARGQIFLRIEPAFAGGYPGSKIL